MFFSIYDLLISETIKRGQSEDTLLEFFKKKRVKKSILNQLKDTVDISSYDELLLIVLEYLNFTELEFNLSLGRLPRAYQNAFSKNLSKIAVMLEADKETADCGMQPFTPYFETTLGKLYHADCIHYLAQMESESVDLVFADPPFNLNKQYDDGVHDDLSKSEYIHWCYQWLDECIRILKPGGSIYVYNLPKWCIYLAEYLNKYLSFRQWIAIDMKSSLPISGKLSPSHYGLLHFIKGARPNTFHNQRMPLQTCRYCGGEIKDYGGYKAKMNPSGVNVSDVWTDIYPVRHKTQKNRAFNELSVKLLDRIISMSTNIGDVVFDPFGGSGTTYIVAELLNRNWIGTEIGNCQIISERFHNILKDEKILNGIHLEKSALFPESVKKLRRENGFWLCEDFGDKSRE